MRRYTICKSLYRGSIHGKGDALNICYEPSAADIVFFFMNGQVDVEHLPRKTTGYELMSSITTH
jgi:hypothetical protein